MSIRVLVVDDHELVHLGCHSVLAPLGVELVAGASDGESAVRSAAESHPDVVLLDARLGAVDGLAWIGRILAAAPRARIIVFSAFANRLYLARAIAAGAYDYVLKSAPAEDLVAVIRRAAAGEPGTRGSSPRRVRVTADDLAPASEPGLTDREMGVLRLIAAGRSNQAIATDLAISIETVKEHVQSVLRKTALVDRTQAALWALRHGLG